MESFDRFQLAGLALICLKNETKTDAERDLRDLISLAGTDVTESASRNLLRPDKTHLLELAKYSLERAGTSASRWTSNHDIADCRLESRREGTGVTLRILAILNQPAS